MADDRNDPLRRVLAPLARFALRPDYRREQLHDWRRRLSGEPPLPPAPVRRVLVLCHGNICRSPYAEALLRARCTRLDIRSAGFAAGEGNPADPTALAVAHERAVDLGAHRARLLAADDLAWADLVLVMTATQAETAAARGAMQERVRLLGDYLSDPPHAIADPFGLTPEVFHRCFERIEAAVAQLSRQLDGAS